MQKKKQKKNLIIMYMSPFHYILYTGTNVIIYIINEKNAQTIRVKLRNINT